MMAAFLGSTDVQRRLTALLSGVLGHGGTAQACDPATGCDEVFLRVIHAPSLRLVFLRRDTGTIWNWPHEAQEVRRLAWRGVCYDQVAGAITQKGNEHDNCKTAY